MPILYGMDCLAYLKNKGEYPGIPVVVFTTSRNRQDIARTRQMGAIGNMTKFDDFNVRSKKLNKYLLKDSLEGL